VIDRAMIANVCQQIARLRADGHEVVLVTSGAVSAGVSALGMKERYSNSAGVSSCWSKSTDGGLQRRVW
jgi:glutamate 5-kinase